METETETDDCRAHRSFSVDNMAAEGCETITFAKRQRTSNLTKSDRDLLVDLVAGKYNIIECKLTDGVSARQKTEAWGAVEREFNAVSATKKDAKQLKQVRFFSRVQSWVLLLSVVFFCCGKIWFYRPPIRDTGLV